MPRLLPVDVVVDLPIDNLLSSSVMPNVVVAMVVTIAVVDEGDVDRCC